MHSNSEKNNTKVLLTITLGFIFIFLIFKIKWALVAAVLIGVIGISSDTLSLYVAKAWMKITAILSFIVPNILLTIIYYFILFPIAWLSRLNKNPLLLKRNMETTFTDWEGKIDKAYFERPW